MKVQYKNKSSKKTTAIIQEAFASLLQEKNEIKNITVTELAKKADITRSTFYTHYNNIYDVAKEIQEETLKALNEIDNIHPLDDIDYYFDHIFRFLKENEKMYSMLLKSNDPLIFISKLENIMNKKLHYVLREKLNTTSLNLSICFFTDGCINLIIKYFRKELNCSLDDINNYVQELFKTFFI